MSPKDDDMTPHTLEVDPAIVSNTDVPEQRNKPSTSATDKKL